MAYPAHVAWVASGSLPGGEIWSNTLRTVPELPPVFEGLDLVAGAEAALVRWKTFLTATTGFSTGSSLVRVTGYVYGADGTLVEQATSTGAQLTGNVVATFPNQASVCLSLGTGQAGRSRRGRMYLPLLALLIADGRLRTQDRTAIATAAKGLLEASRGWGYAVPPASGRPVVASATFGYATPITTIRVGDVVDTQQRRRDSLVESYDTRVLVF